MNINDTDWDVIELDLQIDKDLVNDYYKTLTTDLADFCFDFNSKDYIRPEIYETFKKEGRMGNYLGNVGAWTVSWPVERDIPCPSKTQANIEMYPELKKYDDETLTTEFYYDAKPQKRYMFGLMQKLFDTLSESALRQVLIARHPPGLRVNIHKDSELKKLHIPLHTNKDAKFLFGENGERQYQMEVGKIYIINPLVPHGTENLGDDERVHILSRIDFDAISEIRKVQGIIDK
jgi:uncharacterized RmlC-like cupin family protein